MRKILLLALPLMVLCGFMLQFDDGTGGGLADATNTSGERQVRLPVPTLTEDSRMGRYLVDEKGRVIPGRVTWVLEKVEPALLADLDDDEARDLRDYVGHLTMPDRREKSWLCWAEEERESKVAAFASAERWAARARQDYAPLANQFLSGGRWSQTATDGFLSADQGDPVIVTWSIVPDGTLVQGVNGQSSSGSDLRSWMSGLYGGSPSGLAEEQPWFGFYEEAIEAMAGTSGLILRYEANDDGAAFSAGAPGVLGVRGDIRISARFLDGDSGFLGISQGPDNGDMILDSGDGTFNLTGGSSLRLVNTIAHELGHCLGLDHVCPVNQTKLMEPSLTTSFRGPQFDEVQSLQRLYGDRLERRGDFRDNDSAESATLLDLPLGEDVVLTQLSIDDDGDCDYFAFEVLNGQRLAATVTPGEGAYLEGEQLGGACPAGVLFDSRTVHDLGLVVFDQDGESVLVSVDGVGPGEVEQLALFEFPSTGMYFLKVAGGAANAAQLYELGLRLEDRLPGPRLVLNEGEVVAESGTAKNGRPDPNETVQIRFRVENEGDLPAENLSVTVTGSQNVTVFDKEVPGGLAANEEGFVVVVFGAAGVCGDGAVLELEVSDSSGVLATIMQEFGLGEVLSPVPFEEGFDGGRQLPNGWTSDESGAVAAWEALSSRWDSPIRSAFTGFGDQVGEASLMSPSFVLAANGGTLSFRHTYRTEVGFDGGVLEVSRDGADWVDLIEQTGVVVSGGYDRAISANSGSAIAGRQAWTGRLNAFVSTSVELPASWAGEVIQFRWRFVRDSSGLSEGWWVDTIKMQMVVEGCVFHRPVLDLRLLEGGLDENTPGRKAVLALESELPLLNPVAVSLELGGSAGPLDYTGNFTVTLPAGTTKVEIPVMVREDQLDEGLELLTVAIPGSLAEFSAGPDGMVALPVRDRVNFEEWLEASLAEAADPLGDSDGDGYSELAEYLLGTNPAAALSRPLVVLNEREVGFLIPLGILPERDDAVLGVEFSSDLFGWRTGLFELTDEGMIVEPFVGERFVRLTFSRDQ